MRIAIFGCRDGSYLHEQIKLNKENDLETVCFCDNNERFRGTEINGLSVLSIDELAKKYEDGEVDCVVVTVRKGYSRYCIIEQVKKHGIDRIRLLRPSPLTFRLPIIFDAADPLYDRYWLDLSTCDKPVIHHLEAHAADGCNLNCRGCLHFSNLFDRDAFPDLDSLLADVREIAEHCEIFQFRVLGGEPLLNKKLPGFLTELRRILPNSDLAVISNGILIPKIDPELFRVMADNGIGFNLTLYPPTLKMKDQIENILNTHHVPYGSHVARTDEFEKFMTLRKHETADHQAWHTCVPRGILTVRNGKLYKCPIAAYGEQYKKTYDLNIDYAESGVNIYHNAIDWQDMIMRLTADPIALCTYCSDHSAFYEWSVGQPELNDWLTED